MKEHGVLGVSARRSHFKDGGGFTLLELIIVMGIIAVLVTAAFTAFGKPRSDSRNAARLSQVREVQKALEVYANQNDSRYPLSLSELVSAGVLSKYPTIPDTGTGQNEPLYIPIGNTICKSYHLGVILEQGESAARILSQDQDLEPRTSCGLSSDFHGASTACTQSAGDDLCYDVGP